MEVVIVGIVVLIFLVRGFNMGVVFVLEFVLVIFWKMVSLLNLFLKKFWMIVVEVVVLVFG